MARMLGKWIAITTLCGAILLSVVWAGATQAFESISRNSPSTWTLIPVGKLSGTSPHNDRDCSWFDSREEAQLFFMTHSPDLDPHRLDTRRNDAGERIRNGKACEEFAYFPKPSSLTNRDLGERVDVDRAGGSNVLAAANGLVRNPRSFAIRISLKPEGRVNVGFGALCNKHTSDGLVQDQFERHQFITDDRVLLGIRPPLKHADSCSAGTTAHYVGDAEGRIKLELFAKTR